MRLNCIWAAADLRTAIETQFWLSDQGYWSAYLPSPLDPAPTHRQDALGSALAVLAGLGTETERRDSISNYPHLPKGLPVLWPQQQFTPIYHNRGIWPFVTAFWIEPPRPFNLMPFLMASTVSCGLRPSTSQHGKNLEASTGLPYKGDEGEYSGPVVNSQRQLWSVAGYAEWFSRCSLVLRPPTMGFSSAHLSQSNPTRALWRDPSALPSAACPTRRSKSPLLNLGTADGQHTGALVAESMTLNSSTVPLEEILASQVRRATTSSRSPWSPLRMPQRP